MVTITKVIDGDELRIEDRYGNTRLRLLGIMSFDASANDMVVAGFARDCVDYLESTYVGKRAQLRIAPKRIDGEGRLLGSLYVGSRVPKNDLALEMVKDGLTLVYTRFPFDGMDRYQQAQANARNENRGLWALESVALRAESMMRLWELQRRDEEQR